MTKGHFHATIERPGIYTTFTGFGVLILQPKDENAPVMFSPMEKGTLCYIPPYTGHRVANIGNEKIIYTGTTTTDDCRRRRRTCFLYVIAAGVGTGDARLVEGFADLRAGDH